jgi:dTDP-4-amino-4,6-dideoxygalactose transaminase
VGHAAEAHGAEYKDSRVGALADVGAFSFFGNKAITTGACWMLANWKNKSVNNSRKVEGKTNT